MEVPLAIISETLSAAGSLNRFRQATDESNSLPQIVVFNITVHRILLVVSAVVMVLCVLGLSCQIGVVIQSKRVLAASLGSVLFVWTMILMLLNAKWIIVLSRNRMEMYTFPANYTINR